MTMDPDNQPKEIYNEPGLEALSYRIARHDDSLKRMSSLLHTQTIPGQNNDQRPLAALTTSHGNDPAIAFLDGWATVMEVLTFYQERIANEGFVNTATERRSVLELSRTVGYELDPGVAASTYLAFTIDESEDVPEIITVPEGVRVESVPISDELPQVFETIETLEMRGAWNVLQPHIPSVIVYQEISEDTVQINISGTDAQLAEGDSLLIVEERTESYESRNLILKTVESDDEQDYTVVSWDEGLGWEPRGPLQVFALREQTTLFGSEAPDWNELSSEEKRLYDRDTGGVFSYKEQKWQSISTGLLKNADVRALVREPNSQSLFVGTNYGIFRSADDGKNWVEINKGLIDLDIYSLATNDKGYIFAGATGGNVFRSIDMGESWVEIGSGGVSVVIQYQVPSVQTIKDAARTISGVADTISGTTATILNTAATISGTTATISGTADTISGTTATISGTANTISGTTATISGTANTISGTTARISDAAARISGAAARISNTTDTLSWNVGNNLQWEVKSTEYQETNLPSSIIRCIAVYDNIIYAGTEYGIYSSENSGRTWDDINQGKTDAVNLSKTIIYSIVKIHNHIFVGTDRGIFRSSKNGEKWEEWEEINGSGTPKKLANKTVQALLFDSNSNLFAGTNGGIFISKNASVKTASSVHWEAKNKGLEGTVPTIYAFTSIDKQIYAGTCLGVVLTEDVAENWTQINTGLINPQIRCILCYNNMLLAGSWFDRLHTKDWPGFKLANKQYIDLNGIDDNIFPGSWVVLKHTESSQAYKVKKITNILGNNFGENGKITRIHLEDGMSLSAFGEDKYRETVVLCQSEALKLHEAIVYKTELPVEGDKIELDRVVPGLEEDRKITISGKRMRAKIPPMGGVVRQSLLNDKAWTNLRELWTPTDVNDLSIDKENIREKLFAGTAQGVLSLELGSQEWFAQTGISVLKSYVQNNERYIIAGTAGGVFRHKENDPNWYAMNSDLPLTDVRDFVIYKYSENHITIIASTSNGVFSYDDKGDGSVSLWREMNSGLTNTDVRTLDVYKKQYQAFTGNNSKRAFVYEDGIWVLKDQPDLTSTEVRAIAPVNGDPILGAGTAGGVFIYKAGSWALVTSHSLAGKNVQAPADVRALEIHTRSINSSDENCIIWAGTPEGVFKHDGNIWIDKSSDLINKNVRAIESYVKDGSQYILIGTAGGVFKQNDSSSGSGWDNISHNLPNQNVRALVTYPGANDPIILAGTAEGVFKYENDRWNKKGDLTQHVYAIECYNSDRVILAGTTRGVSKFDNDSWSAITSELSGNISALESYADKDNATLYLLAGTDLGLFRRQIDEINWTKFDREGFPSDVKLNCMLIYTEKGDRHLLAGTEKGIFYINLDKSDPWKNITGDLEKQNVFSLATYMEKGVRTIFVGTTEGDIFSFKSNGKSWIKFDNRLPNKMNVKALTTYPWQGDRYLCAGTELGLFRLKLGTNTWEEFDTDLPNKGIWDLDIYDDSGDISLLAGTNSGIFGRDLKDMRSSWHKFLDGWDNDAKQVTGLKTYTYKDTRYILTAIGQQYIFSRNLGDISWQKIDTEGLTNTEVRSLKIDRLEDSKYLLAGTAGGIFCRKMSGAIWKRFDNGLRNTDVNVLAIYSQDGNRYILAGTAVNICRRNLNGTNESWQELATGWIDRQVRALKLHQQDGENYILAGTAEGVFYLKLNDDSASWTSLNDNNDGTADGLPDRDVRAIDLDEQDGRYYVLVGTKSGVFKGLLKKESEPEPNSKSGSIPKPENLEIWRWTPENRELTNNNVYSLVLDRQNDETTLLAGTKGGNIYHRAISQDDDKWKQMRQALANDVRAIAISSQGQLFIGTGNHCILKGQESIESKTINPEESLVILQRRELSVDGTLKAMPSQQVVAPGSLVYWTLMDKLGFKGKITTDPGEIVLELATDADKMVSEAASLRDVTQKQQNTAIAFKTPLNNTYDRGTVTINGNVAAVTHGETILEEVLGSGDGSKQYQEFALKNPPLTYIPADTPTGSESTLTVRVDGLLWEEVTSLYQLTSPAPRYMTRIDDDGTTRIIFGDGYRGARPTTGEENITATYRSGIGPDGEVAPNTITLVQDAPLGVVEVTNPQAATGAAPPETREEARQNAGLKTLSLDRIISLRDYEYLIGEFSGIGKAQATQLQTPQGGIVQVTIAGRNGTPVDKDSNLYAQIKEAVELARDPSLSLGGGPASKFSLDSYQALLFNVEGKLWINRRYLVSAVMPEVKKALKKAFAFEKRAFAQKVTVAEVVQLIQSIKGVDGVDLNALYLDGYDRQLNQVLEAKAATWDGLEVEPAQLLLLNPAAGSINLTGIQL